MSVFLRCTAAVAAALVLGGCTLDNMGNGGGLSPDTGEGAGGDQGSGGTTTAGHGGTGATSGHGGSAGFPMPSAGHGGTAGKGGGGSGGTTTFPCENGRGDCDGDPSNGCETDLTTAVDACGACGHACPSAANATPSCSNSMCFVECVAGFGNCDGNGANGCETDLGSSVTDCGACGSVCPAATNATPTCSSGVCGIVCAPGKGDCDGDPSNGCETDLGSDAKSCGSCGNVCHSGAHSAPTCAGGQCAIECAPGFASCDGDPTNGCEVDLAATTSDCGACGHACPSAPNAPAVCVASACSTECQPGFSDCNGAPADGCEADLGSSTSCGFCGHVCGSANASPTCGAGGVCFFQCSMGFAHCGPDDATGCETNTAADPANCGTCGFVCGSANATPTCNGGICKLTCSPGFADCDFKNANGCEASLTSPDSCGSCGHVCGTTHAAPSCGGGVCSFVCDAGWSHCGTSDATGCETNTASDTNNCGACGFVCGTANATPSCNAGTCSLACNAGYKHCTGSPAAGCETAIATDPQSCGDCGHVCGTAFASPTCSSGACVFNCAQGHAHCSNDDSTGCETLVAGGDTSNCGACGHVCGASNGSPSCVAGSCSFACTAGFAHCSTNDATGCETSLALPTSCGSCTHVCGAANGTPTCNAGTCSFQCATGYAHCSANDATGCETNLTNDPANCGKCGHSCLTGACVAGKCQPFAIAKNETAPDQLVADATTLYWTALGTKSGSDYVGGEIRSMPKSAATPPTPLANTLTNLFGLSLDATTVYFTTEGTTAAAFADGTVQKVAKTGGTVTVLETAQPRPTGVSATASAIFWNLHDTSELWTAALDGTSPMKLLSTDPSPDMLLLAGNGSLYWTNEGALDAMMNPTQGTMQSAKPDGSALVTVLPGPLPLPVLFSADDTYLYVAARGTAAQSYADGEIVRVGLDGTNPTVLATAQQRPIQTASDGTYVYWTVFGAAANDGAVRRILRDGTGQVETFATGLASPSGIVVDASSVYVSCLGDGTIQRIAK